MASERPASWRMPTRKQMDKLAAAAPQAGKTASISPAVGPADPMPPEYWQAILDQAAADARPAPSSAEARRLCEINRHVLRVDCRRCGRTVEIQKVDALRLYGPELIWKKVGQRLLDDTCNRRTGGHEEDGCWASFS
ncbi:hypothetical protein IVA87_05010 [Bradyrhizobium sp. 147]|nr:hypothetical protein [Bradyrhizobium sp. 179]MCK1599409.1 hypothetical protein [Bradyrhizobium sp. 164]MCK1678842.1 hypothetical protein [Bradyrhizobium sp. 147]